MGGPSFSTPTLATVERLLHDFVAPDDAPHHTLGGDISDVTSLFKGIKDGWTDVGQALGRHAMVAGLLGEALSKPDPAPYRTPFGPMLEHALQGNKPDSQPAPPAQDIEIACQPGQHALLTFAEDHSLAFFVAIVGAGYLFHRSFGGFASRMLEQRAIAAGDLALTPLEAQASARNLTWALGMLSGGAAHLGYTAWFYGDRVNNSCDQVSEAPEG